jgi:hypothetical protein
VSTCNEVDTKATSLKSNGKVSSPDGYCLVASASHQDIIGWRDCAGQWLTELAFSEMDRKDAERFQSCLTTILHAAPELWVSCAKADAALRALCQC